MSKNQGVKNIHSSPYIIYIINNVSGLQPIDISWNSRRMIKLSVKIHFIIIFYQVYFNSFCQKIKRVSTCEWTTWTIFFVKIRLGFIHLASTPQTPLTNELIEPNYFSSENVDITCLLYVGQTHDKHTRLSFYTYFRSCLHAESISV